jgi:hypothetical protein
VWHSAHRVQHDRSFDDLPCLAPLSRDYASSVQCSDRVTVVLARGVELVARTVCLIRT